MDQLSAKVKFLYADEPEGDVAHFRSMHAHKGIIIMM